METLKDFTKRCLDTDLENMASMPKVEKIKISKKQFDDGVTKGSSKGSSHRRKK